MTRFLDIFVIEWELISFADGNDDLESGGRSSEENQSEQRGQEVT